MNGGVADKGCVSRSDYNLRPRSLEQSHEGWLCLPSQFLKNHLYCAGVLPSPVAQPLHRSRAHVRVRVGQQVDQRAWNALADEQRQAWGERARTNRRGGRAARLHLRNGRRVFFRVNSHRLALRLSLLADPPEEGTYVPAPLVKLVITNRASRITLKLRLSGGDPRGVMVASWHPCNPGVMTWHKFVRIGPLPPPVRGMCDITRLYVAKYGVPEVGKKIFIRIQQMRDYTGKLFHVTSAIVPEEDDWDDMQETQ